MGRIFAGDGHREEYIQKHHRNGMKRIEKDHDLGKFFDEAIVEEIGQEIKAEEKEGAGGEPKKEVSLQEQDLHFPVDESEVGKPKEENQDHLHRSGIGRGFERTVEDGEIQQAEDEEGAYQDQDAMFKSWPQPINLFAVDHGNKEELQPDIDMENREAIEVPPADDVTDQLHHQHHHQHAHHPALGRGQFA